MQNRRKKIERERERKRKEREREQIGHTLIDMDPYMQRDIYPCNIYILGTVYTLHFCYKIA